MKNYEDLLCIALVAKILKLPAVIERKNLFFYLYLEAQSCGCWHCFPIVYRILTAILQTFWMSFMHFYWNDCASLKILLLWTFVFVLKMCFALYSSISFSFSFFMYLTRNIYTFSWYGFIWYSLNLSSHPIVGEKNLSALKS